MVLTSKCGKHICGTLDSTSYATFLLFAHFDVNYELLLNRHTTTQNLLIKKNISMYSFITEYAYFSKQLQVSCSDIKF